MSRWSSLRTTPKLDIVGVLERVRQTGLELAVVIVVDDGSTDATKALVRAWDQRGPARSGGEAAKRWVRRRHERRARAREVGTTPTSLPACTPTGNTAPRRCRASSNNCKSADWTCSKAHALHRAQRSREGCRSTSMSRNAALNVIENRTLRLSMTDYHSGYLLYGRRALAALPIERLSNSFDFDLEVIAAAAARGLQVGEAPIPTHYGDETSHLNPVTYGLRVLRVMWNYRRGRYDADNNL